MAGYWYAVVLVFLIQLVLQTISIAPSDRHPICRTDFRYRSAHDWIPYASDTSSGTWKVLIDQHDYQNLIGPGIPPGIWTTLDVDNDGLNLAQGGGGTCTYQIRVPATYRTAGQNNWIFTQAIDYLDAVELIVNATVRFSPCSQRPDCANDYVILHRYDTNTRSETHRINPDNYQPYLGNSQSSRLRQDQGDINADTTIIDRFRRPSNLNYTYLGIQDIGSSGSIIRIFLYYEVCPGKVEGLVTYPEVPHPGELQGSLSRTTRLASCAEHAHNTTSLETYAYGDGRCEQSVTCVCDLGYEGQNICVGCSVGEYRSVLNSSCVVCPANSISVEASENCTCIEGHYRAINYEGVGVACTAPPPPISGCSMSQEFDTAITIQWTNPAHCGGRSDCYYNIRVNDGPPVRTPNSFQSNSQETYIVENLQPDTTYSITVSIHNGVSDQDTENTKNRECSIVARTIQGSVFMLGGITYPNDTAALLEDISGDNTNSLICTTAYDECCENVGRGGFYYPNGDPVLTQSQASSSLQSFYVTLSSGSISLNQQIGESSPPLGRYRCEIPDGRGALQNLYIRIGTAISQELNATEPTTISVAAVVNDVIVLDVPDALVSMIDEVEVQIEEQQTASDSEPQTKAPIMFTAHIMISRSGGQQLTITIPSEDISTMEKGSAYFVKIKPVFKNESQGIYGLPYIFEFSGAARDALGDSSNRIGLLDADTTLCIAVAVTFVATAILVALPFLCIVIYLCKTRKTINFDTGIQKQEAPNPVFASVDNEKSNI